jgi:OOP family OmpA-OmpF porin
MIAFAVHQSIQGNSMNDTRSKLLGLALAGSLVLTPAIGIAADFYGGVGFGQSKTKDYDDYVVENFDDGSITSASFDDSDSALRIFVGAEINPNFSLELGHVDLGEASTSAQSDGSVFYAAGPVKHSASADGLDLSVIGRIPISEAAAAHVRAGFFKWDVSERISDSTGGASGSEDGTDFFFALGGEYRAAEQFGLRAEYAFYTVDAAGGEFDISLLSLSAAYYFQGR